MNLEKHKSIKKKIKSKKRKIIKKKKSRIKNIGGANNGTWEDNPLNPYFNNHGGKKGSKTKFSLSRYNQAIQIMLINGTEFFQFSVSGTSKTTIKDLKEIILSKGLDIYRNKIRGEISDMKWGKNCHLINSKNSMRLDNLFDYTLLGDIDAGKNNNDPNRIFYPFQQIQEDEMLMRGSLLLFIGDMLENKFLSFGYPRE